ncbi:putative DNA-binding domain-containing protein [Rhizorhabdus dicambivorans]|uniref:DUF2063 domain-containing protein n=1 Tax=Rhizorhabdus dicambivorans TaxID=1850238 RepID=A0A2A4FUN4_9SPHN|nr:putative DNA-binding domain-containing protein [Rhizorhabdus dicambivorans]ATE65554.1 DUF2063 domain-containing protein [Rhizorhabdus dicambivorans]PCE41897.1 DUF2063 domain-containing protein [Rhizorhabdus dicambivorans]
MSLLELQRDFRAWIADASGEAAERLGPGARAGLDVYQNNYRASLVACLSEAFERVRLWIGEERFLSTAAAHIDVTPPHAWTLDAYAKDFPETLELLFPGDPEIAELGWLDLALSEAFVGPDADPLDPAALAAVDWDHAVLRLGPTLTTAPFRSNAAAIWSALSAGEMPPPAERLAEPATVLVWRNAFTSCFRTAEPGEVRAIELARDGASFGAICAALIDLLGEEQGVAAAGAMLGRWIGDGLLVGVD